MKHTADDKKSLSFLVSGRRGLESGVLVVVVRVRLIMDEEEEDWLMSLPVGRRRRNVDMVRSIALYYESMGTDG